MIRTSLSIFNFKIWLKRMGKIAVCIILIGGLVHWLNFLYYDHNFNVWPRILWHNYYAETDNIDYLFLGSSHVYSGINPFLSDKLTGKNNFNLSTSYQRLNGSYYLIKEANRTHDLSHVYLDLYYGASTGADAYFKEYSNLNGNWRNTDSMKFSINKIEYMLSMSNAENYPETFLPFLRYRGKLFDMEYINDQIEYKRGEEYKRYQHSAETVEFKDKGYWYITSELQQKDLRWGVDKILDENSFTEDAEYYLRKIIEYCQEENIEITLFSTPMYELQPISVENYDAYVKQIRQVAAEYGLDYYDFNLCGEEYFPIQNIQNFQDPGHLNGRGAEMFTRFFWKVMNEENMDYFYDTYEEKLEASEKRVYGLICIGDDDMCIYRVASNRETGIEYRVIALPEIEIQDFSENKEFALKADVHGIFRIEARKTGEDEIFESLDIAY